jgi:hypothetical protein
MQAQHSSAWRASEASLEPMKAKPEEAEHREREAGTVRKGRLSQPGRLPPYASCHPKAFTLRGRLLGGWFHATENQ